MKSENNAEEYEMAEIQQDSHLSLMGVNSNAEPINEAHFDSLEDDDRSVTSLLFEELNLGIKGDQIGTFHEDLGFQSEFANYMGINRRGSRWAWIAGILMFAAWLALLLIYSQLNLRDVRKSLLSYSKVEFSGENVTLNPYSSTNKNLTMDVINYGKLSSLFQPINLLERQQYPKSSGANGYYLTVDKKNGHTVKNHKTNEVIKLINNEQFTYKNNFFYVEDIILNPIKPVDDINAYHIVKSDSLPQWRHLSFALFWIFKPSTNEFIPIQPPNNKDLKKLFKLHFTEFSPDGTKVLFGASHDLFVLDLTDFSTQTITDNGSNDFFNGKPDWVYEEEIISSDRFVWWSPDSSNIVYATLNDSQVIDYELDYVSKPAEDIGMTYEFDESGSELNGINQYPIRKKIKYPKVGTAIPKLALKHYSFKEKKLFQLKIDVLFDEFILYDASYINNDLFLIKVTDRTSSILSKQVIKISENESIEVERMNGNEFGGWFDKYASIKVVENGYVDRVVYNNRTHLAYYPDPLSSNPKMLTTSADWDISTSAPISYNIKEKIIYTMANIKGSMDSHLIAIDLEGKIHFVLGDDKDGHYNFQTDNDGQFITLEYLGPEFQWQKLLNMGELHDHEDVNEYLKRAPMSSNYKQVQIQALKYNLPTKVYKTVTIDKMEYNVLEILPPNFNPKTRKYPILVNAYGGPGSQLIEKSSSFLFEDVVSSQLDCIVLRIDPRGTDGRGWNYKSYGLKNIGHWEATDVITITSEYIRQNKKLIEEDAVAIWGWSYGGFTTLKTLETDKGKTFKFGMAVAPVTNFLFYNAFYTERYMKSPAENPNYLTDSLITDPTAFKDIKRFLIMHGTADDNVHMQNLLWLLDKFNAENIENYDVHFFTDSDHNINYHNSDIIIYDKLLHWLQDAFMGKFKNFV